MPLPDALTTTVLSGTYTAPDGTPLGGYLTFTPSSALTNGSGHPVLAATQLTARLQPGTGAFSISLLNTDNDGLLPDTWMWHVAVAVPGAQESYFFGLPSTLGPTADINALTPVSPPPSGAAFVASINGQTGDVVLADGFGILPPAGDLGGGTTLAPHVTATHLASPLPVVQGGTGAATGAAALTALGGISSASPALTGTPTAPTASALTSTTQIATTAYADSAVGVEAARAATAEGLKLAKASNLSDLASTSTARTNLGLGTAATLASSAVAQTANNLSDLANAATARGNLGAQGVRTPTAVKTGTSYTAVAGDFARIDSTAGAYTVTLPSAPADKTVVGVKLVASATPVNAVTITRGGSDTFNVSGGTTLTLKLLNQGVLLQYDTAATAWDVHSDDLPLGGLDSRYATVFSPLAFGAKGDGTTDDTTAVQAAYTAAGAVRGTVNLGTLNFKTTSALTIVSGTTTVGNGQQGGGKITNAVSDMFSVPSSPAVTCVTFRDCSLTASAGHVFNCASGAGCSFWNFQNVAMTQTGAAFAIWYMPSGTYINMLVDQQCILTCSSTATQSPWFVASAGGTIASAGWRNIRVSGNSNPNVPFFNIQCNGATVYASDLIFDNIESELCPAGIISVLSVVGLRIENVVGWDVATYSGTLFAVGTGSGSTASRQIVVRNSGRRGGALGSGAFDFSAPTGTVDIVLENVGVGTGTGTYSLPSNGAAVIINGVGGRAEVQAAIFGNTGGQTGATAASRYMGATASAAPATGTFVTGDWIIDQTGKIWICTTGGTPGTWANSGTSLAIDSTASDFQPDGTAAAGTSGQAADAKHVHPYMQDPLQLGAPVTYIPGVPGVTATNSGAGLNAWYYRLVSGGYSISHVDLVVGVASGNISVAAYKSSGTLASAQPTGSQYATSGGVPCPSAGAANVSLGSSVTPQLIDFLAVSADNATATIFGGVGQTSTNLPSGQAYLQAARSDTGCGTTSGSPTVTDAAAASGDVGKSITNANIPANTTITAVSAGTGYTLSANASATASSQTFVVGFGYPLPSTPASLTTSNIRIFFLRGS